MTTEEPCRHFERCRAVLRGEPDTRSDHSARKLLTIALSVFDTDVLIRPREIEMRFGKERSRRRHVYIPELGPSLVQAIMTRLGVARVSAPIVGVLDPSRATLRPLRPQFDVESAAWVVPRDDDILICLRPLDDRERRGTGPIPAAGPWSLPPRLPEPGPATPRYVDYPDGLACPRCGEEATTYRALDTGYLVCPACGCSFKHASPE